MAFNVKTRRAQALWQKLLETPEGERHGITGFWVASLNRVRTERLLRVAYLPEARFVFEADIDPDATHRMVLDRMDEYLEHERLKLLSGYRFVPDDELGDALRRCISQGRIVVAFRDARPYDAFTNHTGKNPIWYTRD